MNSRKCVVGNLTVEITRRCNLKCKHCMRGEAECVDISYRDVDSLFSLVNEVHELYITGGEPSLCVPQLRYIVHLIQERNIKVDRITIISNGQGENIDEYIQVLSDLSSVCRHPMRNTIAISVDSWHGSSEESEENFDKSMRSFLSFKRKARPYFNVTMQRGALDMLKGLGRAKQNQLEGAHYTLPIINEPILVHEDEKGVIIQQLEITAKGNIRSLGDNSFIDEDLPENIMCHISAIQDSKSLLEHIASWNEKESVRIIGTLFVLARRINTGCLTCPHFRHTYFSGINTAAKIIESEGFMNLLKSERDFLLNALDWDAHKEYAFLSCGCSLTAMCDWWNQPYFRGNALQTFKRVASIQTDIFKKKVEIEKGKDTN